LFLPTHKKSTANSLGRCVFRFAERIRTMTPTKRKTDKDHGKVAEGIFLDMFVLNEPEPIKKENSPQSWGTPNGVTVKAMMEAREGKKLVKFSDAKTFFDDLNS
jgi:hypothetical protein